MIPWRGREPAAEAKKAGSASEDTLYVCPGHVFMLCNILHAK
jgi:hypothetical protein